MKTLGAGGVPTEDAIVVRIMEEPTAFVQKHREGGRCVLNVMLPWEAQDESSVKWKPVREAWWKAVLIVRHGSGKGWHDFTTLKGKKVGVCSCICSRLLVCL